MTEIASFVDQLNQNLYMITNYSESIEFESATLPCSGGYTTDIINIAVGCLTFIVTLAFSIEACVKGKKGEKRHLSVFVMALIGSIIYFVSFLLKFLVDSKVWDISSMEENTKNLVFIIVNYLPMVSYAFCFLVLGTFIHISGSIPIKRMDRKRCSTAVSTVGLLFCVIAFLVFIAILILEISPLYLPNESIFITIKLNIPFIAMSIILVIAIICLSFACTNKSAFSGFTTIMTTYGVFMIFCVYGVAGGALTINGALPSVLPIMFVPYAIQQHYYLMYNIAVIPHVLMLFGTASVCRAQMAHEDSFKSKISKAKKSIPKKNPALVEIEPYHAPETEIERVEVVQPAFAPVKVNVDRKKQISENQAAVVAF